MKVNLSKKLMTFDKVVMLMNPNDAKSHATLQKILPQVLLGTYPDEKLEAAEKLRRYKLAGKINDSVKAEIDISIEDIAYIKHLAGIACDTLTYGQIDDLLPK